MDRFRGQHPITFLMWALLIVSGAIATWQGNWAVVFVALVTLVLTLLPVAGQKVSGIALPAGFVAAVTVFITGTLFLGEAGDFYERFWWWDMVLHAGSAVGFGMIGTVLALLLAGGRRDAVPPALAALLAFCFAVSIGTLWEIFEFAMDQLFGLNMQKSGLRDTMSDLIVDCIGAAAGAMAGYAYLSTGRTSGLAGPIAALVRGLRRSGRR